MFSSTGGSSAAASSTEPSSAVLAPGLLLNTALAHRRAIESTGQGTGPEDPGEAGISAQESSKECSLSALKPFPPGFPRQKRIPGTCFVVDGFRESGPHSQAYFLSHFHSDHYTGLTATWRSGIVYCSPITARLVASVLGVALPFIQALPLNSTAEIDGCHVTLIDAHHCPGAVVFLFRVPAANGSGAHAQVQEGNTEGQGEAAEGSGAAAHLRYVHTGDMRFHESMLQNPFLQGFIGADAVYLDTTYCNPKYVFPPQDAAVEYVAAQVQRALWGARAEEDALGSDEPEPEQNEGPHGPAPDEPALDEPTAGEPGPDEPRPDEAQSDEQLGDLAIQVALEGGDGGEAGHRKGRRKVVVFIATYVIGKEKVLLAVARRCGCKVFVEERKWGILSQLDLGEQAMGAFTTDPDESCVHVVGWGFLGDTWPFFRPNYNNLEAALDKLQADRAVGFVPTGWTYELKKKPFSVRRKGRCEIHLVPYSEHSNYEELRALVRFLRPVEVVPTVGLEGQGADGTASARMRAHFQGLVDATAGKAKFLTRFTRAKRGAQGRPALMNRHNSLEETLQAADLPPSSKILLGQQGPADTDSFVGLSDAAISATAGPREAAPGKRKRASEEDFVAAGFIESEEEKARRIGSDVGNGASGEERNESNGPDMVETEGGMGNGACTAGEDPMQVSADDSDVDVKPEDNADVRLSQMDSQGVSEEPASQKQQPSNGAEECPGSTGLHPGRAVTTRGEPGKGRPAAHSRRGRGTARVKKKTKAAAPRGTGQQRSRIEAHPRQQSLKAFFAHSGPAGQTPPRNTLRALSSPETPGLHRSQSSAQGATALVPSRRGSVFTSPELDRPGLGGSAEEEVQVQQMLEALAPLVTRSSALALLHRTGGAAERAVDLFLREHAGQAHPAERDSLAGPGEALAAQVDRADAIGQAGGAGLANEASQAGHIDQFRQAVERMGQVGHVEQAGSVDQAHDPGQGDAERSEEPEASAGTPSGAVCRSAVERGLCEGRVAGGDTSDARGGDPVAQDDRLLVEGQALDPGLAAYPDMPPRPEPEERRATRAAAFFRRDAPLLPAPSNTDSGSVMLPVFSYHPVEHAPWAAGQPAPYVHLARAFEAIERESGRLKMGDILCNMFRSLIALSPEDVLPAVYLTTNRIAPDFERAELNMGGATVAAAVGDVTGVSRARLRELYSAMGDLGDAAQACRSTQRLLVQPQPLSIRHVYDSLWKLSGATGQGSGARRKEIVAGLLRRSREAETRYLVRTLLQNMRIGAMMRTVLPALSTAAALQHASPAGPVEASVLLRMKGTLQAQASALVECYNAMPDLGILVPLIMDPVASLVEAAAQGRFIRVGTPLKPMLAKVARSVEQVAGQFKGGAFCCEYKYDGRRAQVHVRRDATVRIFSRNSDDCTAAFPDAVAAVLRALPRYAGAMAGAQQGGLMGRKGGMAAGVEEERNALAETAAEGGAKELIIDAEIVAVDPGTRRLLPFQKLSTRDRGSRDGKTSVDSASIEVHICVFMFDLLFLDGQSLLKMPLRERKEALRRAFPATSDTPVPGGLAFAAELVVEAPSAEMAEAPDAHGSAGTPRPGTPGVCPGPGSEDLAAERDPLSGCTALHQPEGQACKGTESGAMDGEVQGAAVAQATFAAATYKAASEAEDGGQACRRAAVEAKAQVADRRDASPAEASFKAATGPENRGREGGVGGEVLVGASERIGAEEERAAGGEKECTGEGNPQAHGHHAGSSCRTETALQEQAGPGPDTSGAPQAQDACALGSTPGGASAALDPVAAVTEFLGTAITDGCEGLMVKALDGSMGVYQPNKRSDNWLKLKRDYIEGMADSLDLVPIGAWQGSGRKSSWFSPFLLACYNPDTETYESVCRVMSGFTDAFYAETTSNYRMTEGWTLPTKPLYYVTKETPPVWFSPRQVWEIRGADLTLSPVHKAAAGLAHPERGISLRFPRFIRVRDDKSPEDASTSQDVFNLYDQQTRKL